MGRWSLTVLAGLLVFALVFPWGGGQDSDPPTCLGMFGWYTVPCGGWPAIAAGVAAGLVVWLLIAWGDGRH